MSSLTDKVQNCGLCSCDCKSITYKEAKKAIEEVKQACIDAVHKCDFEFTSGGYMGGQETCIKLDDAIKAIQEVE